MIQSILKENAKKCVCKGWHGLLDTLYDALPEDTFVMQVKEKWGGLRFYVGPTSGEFLDLIEEMEDKSYTVCEECGAPGRLRTNRWYVTLCDACAEKGKK